MFANKKEFASIFLFTHLSWIYYDLEVEQSFFVLELKHTYCGCCIKIAWMLFHDNAFVVLSSLLLLENHLIVYGITEGETASKKNCPKMKKYFKNH